MRILITWAIMSLAILQCSTALAIIKQDSQLLCLAKNIYYEAGLESRDGMIAVAQVTLNRAEDDKFPKTVCGVVNQKTQVAVIKENKPAVKTVCQFSWVCNPPAPVKFVSDRWQESLAVAEEVMYQGLRLDNEVMAEALYFHNTQTHPNWGLMRIARIGGHVFYSSDPAPKKRLTTAQK